VRSNFPSAADGAQSDDSTPGPGLRRPPVPDSKRAQWLLDAGKRMQAFIALAYIFDIGLYFGYRAAGYVDIRIPIAVLLLFASHIAGVRFALVTG
jgi:hypothetical protein